MNVLELSEQEIIRRNSLNELRAMGIEPYPAAEYVTNAFSTDIKAEFKDDEEPRKVSGCAFALSSWKTSLSAQCIRIETVIINRIERRSNHGN